MKTKKVFDIYAEFGTRVQAEEAITNLHWLKFNGRNDLILACDYDPNPLVVKIVVPELATQKIRALAEEIGAWRVTHNFAEIFPASLAPSAKKDAVFLSADPRF